MAYEKLNFSRSVLMGLSAAPAGKRTYYSDAKEPGLLLCVTAAGSKSFQVYVKVCGRPIRVPLGRFNPNLVDSIELPRDCSHNDFLANAPELNIRMARPGGAGKDRFEGRTILQMRSAPSVRKYRWANCLRNTSIGI